MFKIKRFFIVFCNVLEYCLHRVVFNLQFRKNDVIGAPEKILPWVPRFLSAALILDVYKYILVPRAFFDSVPRGK